MICWMSSAPPCGGVAAVSCLSWSIVRTFFKSSGMSPNAIAARSQRRCSIAGMPLTRAPDGTSSWTMLATPTVTSSPSVRCPSTPDFAASVVRWPSRLNPATPLYATSKLSAPMSAAWPICTKLSSFAPRRTNVSPSAGRSMQLLAPTSTSSSTIARPTCGIFTLPSGVGAKPKPSLPTTAPGFSQTRSPTTEPAHTVLFAIKRQSRPTVAASPTTAPASTHDPGPTVARGPTHANASIRAPSTTASGATCARGSTPGARTGSGWNSWSALAKPAYGSAHRISV